MSALQIQGKFEIFRISNRKYVITNMQEDVLNL